MLTSCPECQLQVSDKAATCPHCGYPLQNPKPKNPLRKNSRKRMRLPNGFGQISEIKGQNLRKPFRAMVSDGKKPNGRPIVKPLKPESYFETYKEAYEALLEYNKNPYDLSPTLSVKEVYEKWSAEYFKTLTSDSSVRTITSAWAYCGIIADMPFNTVRARHLKGVLTDGYRMNKGKKVLPSAASKARIKSLFNLLFDYAVEYELTDKNYARTFDISQDIVDEVEANHKGHLAFTADEMKTMWENINVPWVDLVLIQCYTGWRPQEIGLILRDDLDLENWTMIGGMKTDAGKDRIVPVHPRIRDLVMKYHDESAKCGSKYLFPCDGQKLTYEKYQGRFNKVIEALRLNPAHRPHDGRKQFVTAAKDAGMDEYAIKYIVGHKISDVTEKVYTQREVEWLMSEIKKIK